MIFWHCDIVFTMGLYDTLVVILYICLPVAYCGRLSDLLDSQELLHRWMLNGLPKLPSNMPQYKHLFNGNYSEVLAANTLDKIYKKLLPLESDELIAFDKRQTLLPSLRGARQGFVSKRPYTNSLDSATVEILLVVDNSIYRKFLRLHNFRKDEAKRKIVQYFSIVFAMVDERYKSITDTNLSIRINICDIAIAETRRDAAWIEFLSKWSKSRQNGIVAASRALRRFQKWLKKNKSLLSYDHAVLVTNYILSKKKQQVDGLAYVGTMCKTKLGKSASIVHDTGDFQSVGIIAHELAHSLGVQHDGTWKTRVCPETDNYIMAPQVIHSTTVARNMFRFSKCSIKQLKSFIRSPQSQCLKNRPRNVVSYNLQKTPPGEIFDVNNQCQRAFGNEAYFCDQSVARANMCSRLWCVSPATSDSMCRSNNRLAALPGTNCGIGQHCQLGECVATSTQVNSLDSNLYSRIKIRDDRCPLGDGNPSHCEGLIRASPYLCDNPRLREYCCESCDTLNS